MVTGAPATENTSGQGSLAVVPKEIQGWNWGAFLLNWIWGIGNKVWLALITIIALLFPLTGFIMAIVLGVKGNEWAWRNKRWDSIEQFKRTQRTWTYWGIGLLPVFIPLFVIGLPGLLGVVIPNLVRHMQ